MNKHGENTRKRHGRWAQSSSGAERYSACSSGGEHQQILGVGFEACPSKRSSFELVRQLPFLDQFNDSIDGLLASACGGSWTRQNHSISVKRPTLGTVSHRTWFVRAGVGVGLLCHRVSDCPHGLHEAGHRCVCLSLSLGCNAALLLKLISKKLHEVRRLSRPRGVSRASRLAVRGTRRLGFAGRSCWRLR
jgi:hypothetical protein